MSHSRHHRWFYKRYPAKKRLEVAPVYYHSLEFVRQEFFNLDVFAFQRFLAFYTRKYGYGATQYLNRTYYNWRSGITSMSKQTERRILECVPPFLEKDKQFQLLSFYIPSVIEQQKCEFAMNGINF
jgi:hypothetical protein